MPELHWERQMSPQTMRRSNAYDHLTCRELQLYGGDSTHTHTLQTQTPNWIFSVSQINDKQPSLKRAVCVQERFFILLRFQQPFVSDGWGKGKSTNTFVIWKKKKKKGMVTSRMGRKRESLWRPFILEREVVHTSWWVWFLNQNLTLSFLHCISNSY